MAKVSGPLMSMDARGKFGNTLVFSGWKGRPTVRQLVTPSNPQSANQQISRNRMRVTAAAQAWANTSTLIESGRIQTDKAEIQFSTPSGQAWNGTLVKAMIGAGGVNYIAAEVAYNALSAGEKTAWDVAAAGYTKPFPAVNQVDAGGTLGAPLTGGHALFLYQYGLLMLTIAETVGAVPPVYA